MADVFAARYELTSKITGASAAELARRAVVQWLGRKRVVVSGLSWADPASDRLSDGSTYRWAPFQDESRTFFDFSYRHPDSVDSELTWSTQVAFLSDPGTTTISIRVANIRARGAGSRRLTSRPRLLLDLHDYFALSTPEGQLSTRAMSLSAAGIDDFVRHVLCDPRRTAAIAILTPDADGDFVIEDRRRLAADLFGLAELYVFDSPLDTFALTRALGSKELSVFNGAMRIYLPGFALNSDPFAHPLLMPMRLAERSHREQLAKRLALATVTRFRDDPTLDPLREERALRYDLSRRRIADEMRDALARVEQTRDYVELYQLATEENTQLAAENQSLLAQVDSLRGSVASLDKYSARLRWQLEQAGVSEAVEVEVVEETPAAFASVLAAVNYASRQYATELYFLPSAVETAQRCEYRDATEVHRQLASLATIARRIQEGSITGALTTAFKDAGLDYASGISGATSKKMRRQYEFRDGSSVYRCEEHLRKGKSYDPKESFRIYFTTANLCDERIVIGHVGPHLDTKTTS